MRVYLITSLLFISINFQASCQTFVKATKVSPSSSEVVVSAINIPPGGQIFWQHNAQPFPINVPIYDGDTIDLAGFTDNWLSIMKDGSHYALCQIDNLIKYNYQIIDYQLPSSPSDSNGYLILHFDNGPNSSWASDNTNTSTYPSENIDNNTVKFDSIRYGQIAIVYHDIPGINGESIDFLGYIGNPEEFIYNNDLILGYDVIDSSKNCYGEIQLFSANAIGNVSYYWNNNTLPSSAYQDNLCSDLYSIYAIDEALQEAYIEIPIVGSDNIYTDSSVYEYTGGDTVYYNFINCGINYSLPIDSINHSENLISDITNYPLVYTFDLIVYQDSKEYTFSDTLFVYQNSNLYIVCSIYCDLLKSAFNGKKVELIRHGELSLSAKTNEVDKMNNTFILTPNPTNDWITIIGDFETGIIMDINGRELDKIDSNQISLHHLKPGLYFIKFDNSRQFFRIIKN